MQKKCFLQHENFALPLLRIRSVLFKSVDKAREHKENNADGDQDNSELFPSLAQCVDQTLKSREMSDHLENPKNSQNPGLYRDLKTILREKIRTRRIMLPALLIICMLSSPG